jgi:hypothetical protein
MPSGENQYEEEVLFLVSPVEVEGQRRKADAACGLTCHDGGYEEQYCQLSKLTSMMSSLLMGSTANRAQTPRHNRPDLAYAHTSGVLPR